MELSDVEQQYLQRRLSEERFAIAMLQFMCAPSRDLPEALE
jgi:hypothetical protein